MSKLHALSKKLANKIASFYKSIQDKSNQLQVRMAAKTLKFCISIKDANFLTQLFFSNLPFASAFFGYKKGILLFYVAHIAIIYFAGLSLSVISSKAIQDRKYFLTLWLPELAKTLHKLKETPKSKINIQNESIEMKILNIEYRFKYLAWYKNFILLTQFQELIAKYKIDINETPPSANSYQKLLEQYGVADSEIRDEFKDPMTNEIMKFPHYDSKHPNGLRFDLHSLSYVIAKTNKNPFTTTDLHYDELVLDKALKSKINAFMEPYLNKLVEKKPVKKKEITHLQKLHKSKRKLPTCEVQPRRSTRLAMR